MERITMDFLKEYLKKLKAKINKIDKIYNVFIINLRKFYYDGMRRVNYTVIQEYGEELRIFEIDRQPLEDYIKELIEERLSKNIDKLISKRLSQLLENK